MSGEVSSLARGFLLVAPESALAEIVDARGCSDDESEALPEWAEVGRAV